MRTQKWIGVALVALLVGAAAGYALRGSSAASAGISAPAIANELPRPVASQGKALPDPAPRPEAALESLRDVLERYRPATLPGNATLDVLALDNLGRGIEGATVVASHYVSSPYQQPQPIRDPMESLLKSVEDLARESLASMDRRQTGVTDASGRVTFSSIVPGTYLIRGEHPDWQLQHGSAVADPAAEFVLQGTPLRKVPVKVQMPDGTAPPRCKLTASLSGSSAGTNAWTEWLPSEPTIRLQQGLWFLRASMGDDLMGDAMGFVPTIGEPPEVTIQLSRRFEISGRVSFTGVRPSNRLELNCAPLNPGDPVEAGLLGPTRYSSSLSRDDAFKFAGLQPGRYCISARVGGKVLTYVAAEAGTEVELMIDSPRDPACRVVVEPPELVVESWRFTLVLGQDRVSPDIWKQPVGELEFYFPEPRKGAPIRLSLHTERHGVLGFTGNWTKGMQIKLTAEAPAILQVRLNGVPPALERALSLQLAQLSTGWSWDGLPVAVGDTRWWTTGPFQPGELVLCVKATHGFQWIYDKRSILCTAGENFVSIDFPQVWTLTVSAAGFPQYAILESLDEADNAVHISSLKVDANMLASLACVPAGRYRIRYGQGGDKSVDFSVPATDRVFLK